jgi:NCS1 family nucleobase:cation symporter-1
MAGGDYGQDMLPVRDRYAGAGLMFWLWAGGNVLLTTFLLGGYYAAGLGAVGVIVVSIFGSALGSLFPALTGLRSARYGVDEFIGMRSTYGRFGSYIGVLLLIVINLGWMGILAQIAGTSGAASMRQLTHSGSTAISFGANWFTLFGLLVGLAVPVAMIWISPKTIFQLCKWTVPLLIGFALWLLIKQFADFGWHGIHAIKPDHSVNFAYGIEAAVAYNLAWLPYMGAWNRFSKTDQGTFWGTWLGLGLASMLFAIVGGFATLTTGSADPSVWATKSGLGLPALYIIIFSTVINVAMNFYCSVMAVKGALPKVSYHWLAVIIALPVIPFLYAGSLTSKFNEILTTTGAFLAPYWGIALADYFLIRRQRIVVADLYRTHGGRYWFNRGWNVGAIGVWVLGVILWEYLAGWSTSFGIFQSIGKGESLYNYFTASVPVILLCGAAYYLVGQRVTAALMRRSSAAQAAFEADVKSAGVVGGD